MEGGRAVGGLANEDFMREEGIFKDYTLLHPRVTPYEPNYTSLLRFQ